MKDPPIGIQGESGPQVVIQQLHHVLLLNLDVTLHLLVVLQVPLDLREQVVRDLPLPQVFDDKLLFLSVGLGQEVVPCVGRTNLSKYVCEEYPGNQLQADHDEVLRGGDRLDVPISIVHMVVILKYKALTYCSIRNRS